MLAWIKSFFKSSEPDEAADQVQEEEIPQVEKSIKKSMQDSKDNSERFQTILASGVEIAKVCMATLLSLFVPQYCPDTGATCTLEQNLSDLTGFNKFVIAMNFISLGLFAVVYWKQNAREFYLISHLDSSKDHAYNSLTKNIKEYPKIISRVKRHNTGLLKFTRICVAFFIVNTITSAVLVFRDYYDGFRSVTTLLANVLLVSQKLWSLWSIVYECCGRPTLALSTVRSTQISFNVIDPDYSIEMTKLKRAESFAKRGESVRRLSQERFEERVQNVEAKV
jgi:hypothetical protein